MSVHPTQRQALGEIATPAHGRALGLLGVSLTSARMPKGCEAALTSVRDQLEQVMLNTEYLQGAPFSWVTISIQLGLKDEVEPKISAINRRHGDLPMSIEIDVSKLQGRSLSEYRAAFLQSAARALCSAGRKYACFGSSVQAFSQLAEHNAA